MYIYSRGARSAGPVPNWTRQRAHLCGNQLTVEYIELLCKEKSTGITQIDTIISAPRKAQTITIYKGLTGTTHKEEGKKERDKAREEKEQAEKQEGGRKMRERESRRSQKMPKFVFLKRWKLRRRENVDIYYEKNQLEHNIQKQ